MKHIIFIVLAFLFVAACTKTETATTPSQTIITTDSSEYTGRLQVKVFDAGNSQSIQGADVFLYPTYEDLKRNFYLNTLQSSASGVADFGYILQGNYYLRATLGAKSDTNVVQVLGRKTITRNMFIH